MSGLLSKSRLGAAFRGLLLALLVLPCGPAWAHKSSDAYLQLIETPGGITVRWDMALRDLDVALDLDTDGNGQLTWGEIKAGWSAVEDYARPHLRIEGCTLRPTAGPALERRNDGVYAVLQLAAGCRFGGVASITYTLFADVDPTHRGILRIQQEGQPIQLAVLDPTESRPQAARTAAAAASTVRPGAAAAAAGTDFGFVREGMRHILTGYDHVLFLLCLLLPAVMRRTPQGWQPVDRLSQAVWPVVGIVSAFTVAHSITLALAATGWLSLPSAFIEPAIAVTIVLAALDNIWRIFPVRRIVVTFFFGLIHGFGFASVLAELDLPAARFAWALLQFNLGLEAGQVLIVAVVTSVLFLARRQPAYAAIAIRGGSAAAVVVGLLWLVERSAGVSLLPL